MAGKLQCAPVITRKHLRQLAANIRAIDRDEIEAMHGEDCNIYAVLKDQVDSSSNCVAALLDGQCVAIFGCEETEYGAGSPWMLGARQLRTMPFTLHRHAVEQVAIWRTEYRYLVNTVWDKSPNVDWLRRLGFLISDSPAFVIEHGGDMEDEDFVYFFMGGV